MLDIQLSKNSRGAVKNPFTYTKEKNEGSTTRNMKFFENYFIDVQTILSVHML